MSSFWGERLRLQLFGESHGPGIGVTLDNLPPAEPIDLDEVRAFLRRRAPGRTPWSTPRREADEPEIISGLFEGRTTGTPLTALIRNTDTRSKDYAALARVPRPSHADLTGRLRYRGANDPRGGGHFSGRLTAPLCFAGAIALQILARQGIGVYAHLAEIGGIADAPLEVVAPDAATLAALDARDFPVLDEARGQAMIDAVMAAKRDGDSLGGVVEAIVVGAPAGLGDPIFGGVEARLASIVHAIPAVKAVGFGDGFDMVRRHGSQNNDSPVYDGDRLTYRTNHGGGVDGGITNGMPIVIRAGVKPTASIVKAQPSVDLVDGVDATLQVHGRHDPCIATRAVPVVVAALAVGVLDLLLAGGRYTAPEV